jgi:hypothetical protein
VAVVPSERYENIVDPIGESNAARLTKPHQLTARWKIIGAPQHAVVRQARVFETPGPNGEVQHAATAAVRRQRGKIIEQDQANACGREVVEPHDRDPVVIDKHRVTVLRASMVDQSLRIFRGPRRELPRQEAEPGR